MGLLLALLWFRPKPIWQFATHQSWCSALEMIDLDPQLTDTVSIVWLHFQPEALINLGSTLALSPSLPEYEVPFCRRVLFCYP